MAIGDLYSAANVVTGQAAVFVAPDKTALPNLAGFNTADPFDPTMWLSYLLNTGSITSFTLTFARRGATATTSSLTVAGLTATQIQNALGAIATVGSTAYVAVTGTAPAWNITLDEFLQDGILTLTPTGGAGSSLTGPIWKAVGATEQGWQFSADKSTQTIAIEEQSTPVGTTISSQSVSIQGNLSEDITSTLLLALNATKSVVAPTTQIGGYDLITPTDLVLQYAVALVTTNAEGYGRLIYAPSWTSLAAVSAAFRRAAGQRLYGVTFATVCDTSKIEIRNFTAPHT
jgi:hypothetical protein